MKRCGSARSSSVTCSRCGIGINHFANKTRSTGTELDGEKYEMLNETSENKTKSKTYRPFLVIMYENNITKISAFCV